MVATQSGATSVESVASDFATFGAIHLDVTDGERAVGFWRDLVGLELLGQDDAGIRLGVGGRDLVVLHPGATGPVVREAAGLYHLSFHLPSLAEFARVYARIEAAGYFQYPTDHAMHIANYVDDPDGIGLELAYETSSDLRASWEGVPGYEPGERGYHWGGRDPRYLAWLDAQVPDGDTKPGLPAGTVVGHMHLRAADTSESLAFYRDLIGFTPNKEGTPGAMFDMSAGGTFSHRLACNSWESAGRPQRPADVAGMRYFTVQLRNEADRDAIVARLEAAGKPIERRDDAVIVADPAGTRLILAVGAQS
ncbi:MAG: VOC family protein [Thermomicrobiales bacterium]